MRITFPRSAETVIVTKVFSGSTSTRRVLRAGHCNDVCRRYAAAVQLQIRIAAGECAMPARPFASKTETAANQPHALRRYFDKLLKAQLCGVFCWRHAASPISRPKDDPRERRASQRPARSDRRRAGGSKCLEISDSWVMTRLLPLRFVSFAYPAVALSERLTRLSDETPFHL